MFTLHGFWIKIMIATRQSSRRADIQWKSWYHEVTTTWNTEPFKSPAPHPVNQWYCIQISSICIYKYIYIYKYRGYKHNHGISIYLFTDSILLCFLYISNFVHLIQYNFWNLKTSKVYIFPKKSLKIPGLPLRQVLCIYSIPYPSGKCWKYNKHSAYLAPFWWWHSSYQ